MSINFARGVPALESFPVTEIMDCARAVANDRPNESLQYGPARGPASFVNWLAERHEVSVESVLTGDGSLGLFELYCSCVLQPGDSVAVESPTYDRVIQILRAKGANIVPFKLGPNGIDVDELRKTASAHPIKFIYTIPDFQNPSGAAYSISTRAALAAAAIELDFTIVEDAPYRLIRFNGSTLPSLLELAPGHTLHMSSFSKLIAPGLRAGYVVGQPSLIQKMVKAAEDRYVTPGNLALSIAGEWCVRGNLEKQIKRLIQLYSPRLDAMASALQQELPSLEFSVPDGGFFIGASLPPGIKNEAVKKYAESLGLQLSDGRGFFVDGGDHFLRIPFCGLSIEEIHNGARLLRQAVEAAA